MVLRSSQGHAQGDPKPKSMYLPPSSPHRRKSGQQPSG